jgi:predicted CopG family antitoxin
MRKRIKNKLDLSSNHMVRLTPEAYEMLREMKRTRKQSMADINSQLIVNAYLEKRILTEDSESLIIPML